MVLELVLLIHVIMTLDLVLLVQVVVIQKLVLRVQMMVELVLLALLVLREVLKLPLSSWGWFKTL